MRLINFINEGSNKGIDDYDEAIDFMEKNCKPFLKDWKNIKSDDFLYRGKKGISHDIFIGDVRKNRMPMSTKKSTHDEFDRLFYNKFGVKARSQCLFCTSDAINAATYGKEWIIFPVNKYKIIWSPEIEDLFLYLARSEFPIPARDIVEWYIEGNLKDAINSGNEIMVCCDQYLAFSYLPYYIKLNEYFKNQ